MPDPCWKDDQRTQHTTKNAKSPSLLRTWHLWAYILSLCLRTCLWGSKNANHFSPSCRFYGFQHLLGVTGHVCGRARLTGQAPGKLLLSVDSWCHKMVIHLFTWRANTHWMRTWCQALSYKPGWGTDWGKTPPQRNLQPGGRSREIIRKLQDPSSSNGALLLGGCKS